MNNEKIISKEDVQHVADLARLALSESEKNQFTGELNTILGYVKEIEEVTIDNYQRFDHYNLQKNVFREDKLSKINEREKESIRSLFPERDDSSLRVKEALNGGSQ